MKVPYCDRCHKPISGDDRIQDFLECEYSPLDICADCDLLIQAAQAVAKKALIKNTTPGAVLKNWALSYGIQFKSDSDEAD